MWKVFVGRRVSLFLCRRDGGGGRLQTLVDWPKQNDERSSSSRLPPLATNSFSFFFFLFSFYFLNVVVVGAVPLLRLLLLLLLLLPLGSHLDLPCGLIYSGILLSLTAVSAVWPVQIDDGFGVVMETAIDRYRWSPIDSETVWKRPEIEPKSHQKPTRKQFSKKKKKKWPKKSVDKMEIGPKHHQKKKNIYFEIWKFKTIPKLMEPNSSDQKQRWIRFG